MKWFILFLAGLFEIIWAAAMKSSRGFTVLLPSVITAAAYVLSAVFLSLAMKQFPLGIAYVIWVGFGIVGTTLLGVLLFHERLNLPQTVSILLIGAGIIGLKVFAP